MNRETKNQRIISLIVIAVAIVFFATAISVIRINKAKELESRYFQENFDALEEYGKQPSLFESNLYHYYARSVYYENVLEYGEKAIPHLLRRLPSESEIDAMSKEDLFAKVDWILYLFEDIHGPNHKKIMENRRSGERLSAFWRRWLEGKRK